MSRPLRLVSRGSFHHVMARGNARMVIYEDREEYLRFLELLATALQRHDLSCHAYCLMPNHYHLVIETHSDRLSAAIHMVNGAYAQWWNRRHSRVGHVLQGRFKAQLIQDGAYFVRVCRYLLLNPVRANLVDTPRDWPWSSYQAMLGLADAPPFLRLDRLLGELGGAAADKSDAQRRFRDLVEETMPSTPSVAHAIRSDQRVVGDDAFVRQIHPLAVESHRREHPTRDWSLWRPPLQQLFARHRRDTLPETVKTACVVHGYKLREIALALGVHYSTVSRLLRRAESRPPE